MHKDIPGNAVQNQKMTTGDIYDIVSGKLRIAKRIAIPAMIQSKVSVVSGFSVMGTLEPKHDVMTKYRLHEGLSIGQRVSVFSKMFQGMCQVIGTSILYNSTYNLHTNVQMECYNRTIASMLRFYVTDHQSDWYKYIGVLTY